MTEPDEDAPPQARQLTAEAKKQLNGLVARGVPVSEALAQVRARPDAFEPAVHVAPPAPEPIGRPPAKSKEEVDEHLDALAARLAQSGIVPASEAVPVTPAELRKLEARAKLPYSYLAFLSRFGGARCRLFSHDHIAVEQVHLLTMQRKARALGKRVGHPLPEGAFAILGYLSEHYCYVRAEGGIDEPVFALHESSEEANRTSWASVLAWVDSLAEDAERAWNNGYFRTFPHGTSP